jgi:DNA repair exonuclease SbcCD ATPase subunit
LNRKKEELDSQQEKRYRASVADHELQQIRSSYSQQISDAKNKRDYHQTRLREIKQQEEFMKNSGCPDIENASCRFLAKAVDDVKNLPVERGCLQKFEKEIETLTSEMNKKVAEKQKKIWEIGYNPDQLKLLLIQVNGLAKYERIKKDAEQNKLEIARLEAEKESNDKNIGQCEENLLQVKSKASEITETVNELSKSVDRQEQIKQQMAHLQTYVEQEKELPVYEERKQHVLERIESMEKEMEKLTDRKFILSSQLTGMDTMIEKMKETFSADMVEETGRQIRSNKETLGELQIQKGVLLERLENIDTMRGEISMLNNGIAVAAGRADCYEALKQAFSQDGVPHQIIRNIIPHITDTTNNILGQMTGGTMGVEFVMERTVKGKDGDKATLDVLINEYGKTTLPYASKSGGEKVKASLAVILALSEIKATAAGIQLGMLFIDEPPFLDDEGAQAYVDALDYMQFSPADQCSISGIEKGTFTCYEVKSCKEDVYSGNGLNFLGEKNYIVTTMECYKDILPDISSGKFAEHMRERFPESSRYFGVMVAIPDWAETTDEFEKPTPLDAEVRRWKLAVILPCRYGPRKRSMTELLFCMLLKQLRHSITWLWQDGNQNK